ncbi:MAG: DNA replication and repair protein RecF [Candidatus Dojkabacteria bacterium]
MIENIKLTNFRKFNELDIDIKKDITVLHGNNAKGKSTVLEAIYLITNGISPWASSNEFISNSQKEENRYCRIEITSDTKRYSFFKDDNRKILQMDGKKVIPKRFFEKMASTIFNPEQIEILMISPSKRRDFLDEAISIMEYEYSTKLKNFRKILRQRNAYLKKLSKDFYEKGIVARNDTQLNFWTEEFIQISKYIQTKREKLSKELFFDNLKMLYIKSNGDDKLADALENSKKRDIATGYTNVGPHRDDWILSNGEDIKKFGSRGEKRLAIGQMIFKKQEIIAERLGFYPILLLDDIASELDEKNSKKIFDKKLLKKQQTFLTIIDPNNLPKDVIKNAQLIDLNSFK